MSLTIQSAFNNHCQKVLSQCGQGEFTVRPSPKADKHKLQEAMVWLQCFIEDEIASYVSTRRLRSEETWKHYELFSSFDENIKNMVEVKQLKQAKKEVLTEWKSRPGVLRRLYNMEAE